MPLYYVAFCVKETPRGYSLYCTRAPRYFVRYDADRPYETFPELPALGYFGYRGEHYAEHEDLVAELSKDGGRLSYGRIQLSYDGDLDLYIDIDGGSSRAGGDTAAYKLTMPARPDGIPSTEDYPEAKWWYYATSRRFCYRHTHEDYLFLMSPDYVDSDDELPAIGS